VGTTTLVCPVNFDKLHEVAQKSHERRRIMGPTEAVIAGTLNPDGRLELDEKPNLPPGRVQVIVCALPPLPKNDSFSQRMQALWAAQQARGHVPRTVEEVDAERRQTREEWEERMQRIERLRVEAETIRKGLP
jgi:hypothetical protein